MNVALAIILDQGKVLIGKIRSEKINDYGGLPYVFPCECVRDMDVLEGTLIHEVERQTNLEIKIIRKIGERIHPTTQNYSYYFHCVKNSQQTVIAGVGIDFETFIWCDINDLQQYMPTLFNEVTSYLKENR